MLLYLDVNAQFFPVRKEISHCIWPHEVGTRGRVRPRLPHSNDAALQETQCLERLYALSPDAAFLAVKEVEGLFLVTDIGERSFTDVNSSGPSWSSQGLMARNRQQIDIQIPNIYVDVTNGLSCIEQNKDIR